MLSTIARLLVVIGASSGLVAATAIVRTARYDADTTPVAPAPPVEVPDEAARRLAGAIRIPTVSPEDPAAVDAAAFRALHAYLEAAFPRVHAALRRETVGDYSLLYTWPGADASRPAILLAGHLDVVPVEPGTTWREDPFGGRIADGFVWGRGAIDNKSAVAGTLEAVDLLLQEGFRPARTIYLAFGHDEETGGTRGAAAIAALLEARGVALDWVLDEGGVIGDGLLDGVAQPVALVGIAEKGFLTVELSTRTGGGHSSLPPAQSAVGILSAAVARLEATPMPARLEGATRELFDRIGPRFAHAGRRAAFANLWLTRPLVLNRLERVPATNAMVRTTTAATIFQAGTKDNVLPSHARAVINVRILPGDTRAGVLEHIGRVVADPRIEIRPTGRFSAEPSAVSDTGSDAFRALERTIRRVSPDVVVAPCLVVVATDARHYGRLSRQVFRFLPLRLTTDDLPRMHGRDERVAVRHYEELIRTYRQLLAEGAAPRDLRW